jgi:hypothetical protein
MQYRIATTMLTSESGACRLGVPPPAEHPRLEKEKRRREINARRLSGEVRTVFRPPCEEVRDGRIDWAKVVNSVNEWEYC